MAYFPLFIDLEGKYVLAVGGGTVATRRVKALLPFGCKIDVIAPEISVDLEQMVQSGEISWICEEYCGQVKTKEISDNKPIFVLAAAVEKINRKVAEDCKELGIPVNDASNKERCDFYFPGIAKEDDTVIGITAGGSDHKLAASLTAKIRTFVSEEYSKLKAEKHSEF